MRVLGLDVSTYVGMYLLSNGENQGEDRGKCIHFPKERGFTRLQLIANAVRHTLEHWAPHLAIIESYGLGTKGRLVTLVECGTIVRTALYQLKIPWYEVTPTALKKWATGSGAAKKDQMAEAVMKRWGFKSHSDDITDAYALARMGHLEVKELHGIKGVVAGR